MDVSRIDLSMRWAALSAVSLAVVLPGCGGSDESADRTPATPSAATKTAEPGQAARGDGLARNAGSPQVETIVEDLESPWEIAFLPDGRAIVTERPGRVRLLDRDLALQEEPIADMTLVQEFGEGGLLGAAVDPRFEANGYVYFYRTTPADNEVVRYRLENDRLVGETVIADGIEREAFHDGGRLDFGPDGYLYFSTGDAGRERSAQDRRSLSGKVLRLAPHQYRGHGGRPEVFSLGHRNPQGFDWRPGDGQLVATEHGNEGNDEVNILRRGANYGWPRVEGEDHGNFEPPIAVYTPAIAPSGATFISLPGSEWTGDYLIGALVGEQIRRLRLDTEGRVVLDEPLLEGEFGRFRTIVEGPDGALYALTSNTTRGTLREGDDRILRIVPPADG
jgi:glucose/arabinose dehydrogenase